METEDAIVKIISKTLKSLKDVQCYELCEPILGSEDKVEIANCIDSGFISGISEYTKRFEDLLCSFTKAKYAVCTVNGTAALTTALIVCGVQPDDEVLIPALTFVATANAVEIFGAKVHFIDSSLNDLGVCPNKLENYLKKIGKKTKSGFINCQTGRKISALIPMHVFGNPCQISSIVEICNKYSIKVIEDSAEALGSRFHNKHVGLFGNAGIFSFNGNKIITTGGGGAIVSNSKTVIDDAKHFINTAKLSHPYEFIHDKLAYNFRMPGINAALGCAQLRRLPSILKAKNKIHECYEKSLRHIPTVKLIDNSPGSTSNYWLSSIIIPAELNRNYILNKFHEIGIYARACWMPLNKLKMFQNRPSDVTDNSWNLASKVISLPSSPNLIMK